METKVYGIADREVSKSRWTEIGSARLQEDELRIDLDYFPYTARFQVGRTEGFPKTPKNGGREVITLLDVVSPPAEGRNGSPKLGIGFVNRDGSINVVLDAFPVNGRLYIRDRQVGKAAQS